MKAIDSVRWSASRRCWHLPYSEDSFQTLANLIRDGYISVPEFEELIAERKYKYFDKKLTGKNEEKFRNFSEYLKVKRYSKKTIDTYVEVLKTFMSFFRDKDMGELGRTDLTEFNLKYVLKNQFSASYQNQIISAIKIFYRSCYGKEAEFDQIERPIRSRILKCYTFAGEWS